MNFILRGESMNLTIFWELINILLLIGIIFSGYKIIKLISNKSKKIKKLEKDIEEIKNKIKGR